MSKNSQFLLILIGYTFSEVELAFFNVLEL